VISRVIAIGVTLACLASIGIASGLMTDRWGVPADVLSIAGRLRSVPLNVDGWTGTEAPITQRQLDAAGALGYISRAYRSPNKSQLVGVTILCGRPGPISLHEPTVCFVEAGMKQLDAEKPVNVDHGNVQSTFRSADFASPTPGDPVQRTFWSWSTDASRWTTPDQPRIAFVREPALYKVYFSTPLLSGRAETRVETDPEALRFISSFLAQLPGFLQAETPKRASVSRP
jgi:hypothetical protein